MAVFTKKRLFIAISIKLAISITVYVSRNKSDMIEGTLENDFFLFLP
jgi:hypothetical protein